MEETKLRASSVTLFGAFSKRRKCLISLASHFKRRQPQHTLLIQTLFTSTLLVTGFLCCVVIIGLSVAIFLASTIHSVPFLNDNSIKAVTPVNTMPSKPASPVTPRKRRSLRLSSFDDSRDSVSPNQYASGGTGGTTFSRRSSRTSQTSFPPSSPVTPRPMSSHSSGKPSFHRRKSSRASMGSQISLGEIERNGLGSLADELGDAWDEDEVDNQGSSFLEGLREGSEGGAILIPDPDARYGFNDMGLGMSMQSPTMSSYPQTLHPPKRKETSSKSRRHERTDSSYDGSDYGPESDGEDLDTFSPLLAKRIRDIEKVARMSANTEETLSEDGGVIKRTSRSLKDLGPQSGIENGTTRLITAYTSMATHRTHKTRELFTAAHSLLYGSTISNLQPETIDLLLTSIASLSESIPYTTLRSQSPLLNLQILGTTSAELIHTLRGLTDVLQESKLAANVAGRKLKAVRDMVEEMRMEEELTEMSIMLIQAGDWDRRCKERRAGAMCREVVKGFGEMCEGMRERWLEEVGHGLA